jgi:hypothetical protein
MVLRREIRFCAVAGTAAGALGSVGRVVLGERVGSTRQLGDRSGHLAHVCGGVAVGDVAIGVAEEAPGDLGSGETFDQRPRRVS